MANENYWKTCNEKMVCVCVCVWWGLCHVMLHFVIMCWMGGNYGL